MIRTIAILILACQFLVAAEGTRGSIASSAEQIQPLLPGMTVPFFERTDAVSDSKLQLPAAGAENDNVDWADLIRSGPTVVVFYRGGWCPFCNRQLAALGQTQEELRRLGWRIVAISPDRPEKLRAVPEGAEAPPFVRISDSALRLIKAFGLAFRIDDATLAKYAEYGIDLQDASGEDHRALPVPAVFLIGSDGLIHFSSVNVDYRTRLHPEVLLAAARAYRQDQAETEE